MHVSEFMTTESSSVRGLDFVTPPSPSIEQSLEYILSHFKEPVWPRTISTSLTAGKQVLVYNKQEVMKMFIQSNFKDCRINAYPDYVEYKGINMQAPNFLFLDLDKSGFISDRAFKMALTLTLNNIKKCLSGFPTVMWTGNGYHIYQPLKSFVLEEEEVFAKFDKPSQSFLRFAETHLSNNKADPLHNPSFKSCLIRIPGSINTKNSTEVKIMQRWNGDRPKINLLLADFHVYLADKMIRKLLNRKQQEMRFSVSTDWHENEPQFMHWIERILETPIDDHRKLTLGLILAPYLISVRKLSPDEAYKIITNWLKKCDSLNPLDPSVMNRIKYDLIYASRKELKPIRLSTMRERYYALYTALCESGALVG